jgi:hemolysin III
MNRFREPVSGFTHLAGAILGLVGMVWLLAGATGEPGKMVSVLVYGVSLVLLYSASTALHLVNGPPATVRWLQRLDHAAIYTLIAGTYTPICYNLLTGAWQWGLLGVVWAVAVVGVVFKLVARNIDSHLSTLGYVAMGWIALVAAPHLLQQLPAGAIWLILGGGLLYSIGAVIFATRRPNFHPHFGFHEVWHLFVLGGSGMHFAAILIYAV